VNITSRDAAGADAEFGAVVRSTSILAFRINARGQRISPLGAGSTSAPEPLWLAVTPMAHAAISEDGARRRPAFQSDQ
jgi:hypothetical protein